jgi:hypothetical protein
MKKILILVFSDLKYDARLIRQINFLKETYAITVCCLGIGSAANGYKVIILPPAKLTFIRRLYLAALLLLRKFLLAHKFQYPYLDFIKRKIKDEHFDLIIANDIETVPLAFQLKEPGTKVLFDAHEYAPKHFENKLWWRIFFQPFNIFLCTTYIPLTDGMTTIGTGLAKEYKKNFGVEPVVITNASHYYDTKPLETTSGTIKIFHHGIVNRSRKIELIIEIMRYLPENFTLDLVLVLSTFASQQTIQYLKELKELSASDTRIQFREPVPNEKIVDLLKTYDMGIILAPPINFNYANGLPNKLYDYIQARLGVITGPTPEIANVVNTYNIGIVSEDFTPKGIAKKLAPLTREHVQQFKINCNQAAKELSAEKNGVILNNLVASILN